VSATISLLRGEIAFGSDIAFAVICLWRNASRGVIFALRASYG